MNPLLILLIVIIICAIIAGAAFGIYRWMHPKMKQEKRDESHDVQEALDRVLQPIDDEELSKQVQNYKDEEDE